MVEKIIPMTREGRARLEQELEELRTVRRREMADRLQAARELSTAQNNAEYDEAKAQWELNESRIRAIEEQLQRAVLIDAGQIQGASVVQIGSTVVVAIDGKSREYTIVGNTEADPATGKISNESPVGRALLGKRVGDQVRVMAPRGVLQMTVTEIK
jgi:transcription elongation factor GreA